MSKQIRNLGVFLAVCYAALFLQVNRLTIFQADELKERPENTREIERDFSSPRGSIITADGTEIARSVPSDDQYKFQREYPHGPLYAHVTGHYAFELGASGLEQEYNDDLAGDFDFELEDLSDLFVDRDRVGDLTLSMRHDVQQVAAEQLGGREGSVVAVDPRSGEIIAMYSNPSYDPNVLADHNFDAAERASGLLDADPEKPTLARSYQENFFPGSSFKVVTATAGIERGGVTPESPSYPVRDAYQPVSANGEPVGRPIGNNGGTCGGPLFPILQVSCNSAFAEMGAEDVGADGMVETAEAFGFNHEVPIDLPAPAQSVFPTEVDGTPLAQNPAIVAQLAIGQNEVGATPLQMALVAAAVANEGEIMTPHVVREVRDDQGEVVDTAETDAVWARAMDGETADVLREAMIGVVAGGTASRLDDDLGGFEVGGKTGTAKLTTTEPSSHAWIIGFAGPPDEPPSVAVAVIVEAQPGVSEQTGGTVAAPIASAVMQQTLERPAATAD